MMKFPVKLPKGRRVYVAQLFNSTENATWYAAHGLPPEHNGLDVCFGSPQETYGTPFVNPFPSAYVSKITFDNPMSTKGNGITIGSGNLQVVFWHLSEVVRPENSSFKEGDVIGYCGNSGLCKPPPTPENPWGGSHLHLMVFENGVLKNPLDYFDPTKWYEGEDDLNKDFPPLVYFLTDLIAKLKKKILG